MTHVSPSQGFSLHHFMTHLLTCHLATVVKSLHCATHWLNHHPADQYYGEKLPYVIILIQWLGLSTYPGASGKETKPSKVSCLRKEHNRYELLAIIL